MKRIVLLFCLFLMTVRVAVSQEVIEYDGLYYRLTDGETAVVETQKNHDLNPYSGDIVIPEEIQVDGKAYCVTQIEDQAFYRSKITSVDIPKTVVKIGRCAFSHSYSLKTVILRGYAEIGDAAFWGEYYGVLLDKIVCYSSVPPKCNDDCFNCFYESSGDKREVMLEVPKGYADVYANSLYWYPFCISEFDAEAEIPTVETDETETIYLRYDNIWFKLTKGAGVSKAAATHYHYLPFMDKTYVYISSDMLQIPEKIVLNENLEFTVTEIEDNAFYCDYGEECKFNTVVLPGTIKRIGQFAFVRENPSSFWPMVVTTIYCYAVTPPVCSEYSFKYRYGLSEEIVVYVPQGCKEAYEQSPVWSDFTIVEMGTTDLQSPSMPEASPVLFDLQGRQATGTPRKGIYIKNGRKSLYR